MFFLAALLQNIVLFYLLGDAGAVNGAILIGSSERELKDSLGTYITGIFGKQVLGVDDTADLLLQVIDKDLDLAIIDTNLKGLPVAKTVQIIKNCRPRIPVIIISEDYSVSTGSRIMEQGVFYYMYKPVDMDSLREIIDSALKKRAKEEAQERR